MLLKCSLTSQTHLYRPVGRAGMSRQRGNPRGGKAATSLFGAPRAPHSTGRPETAGRRRALQAHGTQRPRTKRASGAPLRGGKARHRTEREKNETRPLNVDVRLLGQHSGRQRGEALAERAHSLQGSGSSRRTSKPNTRTTDSLELTGRWRGARSGAHPRRGSRDGVRAPTLCWRM